MPGQTLRLAALVGRDVDVCVAGVFGAERNPLPVGREVGIRCLALEACQAASPATSAFDYPDVVGVSECDLRELAPLLSRTSEAVDGYGALLEQRQ
jgi:hypothetical protein